MIVWHVLGFTLHFQQLLAIKKLEEKQEVTEIYKTRERGYECLIFSGIYSPTIWRLT
jgi:hypothetical protein